MEMNHMKKITVKELEKTLAENKNSKIKIFLEGIINYNLEIDNAKIINEPNYISICDFKDRKQAIKFNIHQIMKIEQIDKEKFKINFDLLQTAQLKIQEKNIA